MQNLYRAVAAAASLLWLCALAGGEPVPAPAMAGRAAAPLRRRAPARSGARSGSAPGAEPARAPLLVFLDIDGVLLPFGDPPADGEGRDAGNMRFPERCIASLQRILRETGARLVLQLGLVCVQICTHSRTATHHPQIYSHASKSTMHTALKMDPPCPDLLPPL